MGERRPTNSELRLRRLTAEDTDPGPRGILEIFAAFNQVGVTVLVSTHDEALLGRFARKVLRLAQGTLAP